MRALFWGLVVGHVRANRLRALVTLTAVALGVAIALAIDLANATAVASFASSVNIVANHVNLQVLGVGGGFNERTLLRVARVSGVRSASPVIEDSLVIGARRGDPLSGEILRVLGVDLLRPLPKDAQASVPTPGEYDAGASPGPDPYTLVDGQGAFVSQRVATRFRLRIGSPVSALAGDKPVRLRVVGIIPADTTGIDSSVVFVDIATAQETFGKIGRLDRIDVIADDGRLKAVQRAVAAVLPPGARVIQPKVRTSEIARMLRSFQLNLAALSYIALLVGMYLIYNAVAISVVQRRPDVGTLRALGAARHQILATFLAEGALFGSVGSCLGLVLGCALAQFSVAAVQRTVDSLYVASHADHVTYEPRVLLGAFFVGTMLATLSALVPAIEAAATAPAVTMRSAGFEARPKRVALGLALVGCTLLGVAYVLSWAPAVGGFPVFGYAAGLAIILGSSLCLPLALAGLATAARRVTGHLSAGAWLGASFLGSSLRRTSVAVAALMVASAMTVSVAILIGSFRATVTAWTRDTIKADLFVRPLGSEDASYDARFSPNVVAKIRRVSGVREVDTFRAVSIPYRGTLTNVAAVDLSALTRGNRLRFLGHVDALALARNLPGTTGALISEPFATRFRARVGDLIPIGTPSGLVRFRVVAVYNDYSADAGVLLIDRLTYMRLFHDRSVNSLAIYAKAGTDLDVLRTRTIRSVLPLRIDVETTRELRAQVITIFDRTFAITYALYVVSITIGVLGIVNTLFALVLERRGQIGLLRYVGLTVSAVRSMVLYEAMYVGALAALAGIVTGVVLALLLIYVINRQAFGWLITLHMPYAFLGQAVAAVIVAALVAGLYPARIAGHIRTADVVRSE